MLPAASAAESSQASFGKVVYPDWMFGEWKVSSELTSVELPQGDQLAPDTAILARKRVGTSEGIANYTKRYVAQEGQIINDRAFPSQPLLDCLGCQGKADTVVWDSIGNPDVTLVKFKRGSFTVTVNLRSVLQAGAQPEDRADLFNVNELLFAATESPPEIFPIREVRKFKRVNSMPGQPGASGVQELLRLEVYSAMAAEAGASFADPAGDMGTPVAVLKYKALLLPA